MRITEKNYPLGPIFKILTLGLKRYGARIVGTDLYFGRRVIDINTITSISYSSASNGRGFTYIYHIYIANAKSIEIPYTYFSKETIKSLFKDLKQCNPKIHLQLEIINMLQGPKQTKLTMDFKHHKGNVLKNDSNFAMNHPILDPILGFTAVGLWGGVAYLSYIVGEYLLNQLYVSGYQTYRSNLFIIGGLVLGFSLANVIASFASAYLGHKVTIGSMILGFVLFIIALV